MNTRHNTDIYDYKEIWASIKDYHDRTVQIQKKKNRIMKVKRTKYLEYWGPRLKLLKEDTAKKFGLLFVKPKPQA